jgi:hypothetical protein
MVWVPQHHREPGFRAGAVGRQIAVGGGRAVDLSRPQAVRGLHGKGQGLGELTQKIATETAEPIKANASKLSERAA